MAMTLGDEFRVKTTTFNPFVTPRQLATKSTVEHTIFRTTEDVASSLLAFSKHKANYRVSAIEPIGETSVKVTSMHSLKHFTTAGPRQPGGLQRLMVGEIEKGQQLAHLETLDAMKTGVESGKTFTQALDDFNRTDGKRQLVDVTEEGKLGPRVHSKRGPVEYWKVSGGKFTDEETAHLKSNPSPPERVIHPGAAEFGVTHDPLTKAQIEHVASLSAEQRTSMMTARRADLAAHSQLTNAAAEPHARVMRAIMPRTSSVGVGVATGFAAHAVMEGIDPDHRLHPVASEGVEGAISGVMGASAMAALGGSVAMGPEALAGAAAYVAGAESQRAITGALRHGGMDEEGAEAVGSVSGGAIGGVTAVATGVGAAILSDVVFGTTLGTAVGGPVGAALGAGVGVLVGGVAGAIGYLSGRAGRAEPTPEEAAAADYQRRHDDAVRRGEAEHARVVQMSGGQAAYDAVFDRMHERMRLEAEEAAAVEYGHTKDHVAAEQTGRREYLRLGVQSKTRDAVKAAGRARDVSRPATGVSQKMSAKG